MTNSYRLEEELKRYFGYSTFRVGQKEIIMDVLNGHDVLGILPTGTGKSICYQLPARLLDGVTIVVSPLISLMMDQVKELKAMNFKDTIAINSFLDYESKRRIYQSLGRYKLLYVSPEILQQQELLHYLKNVNISLFVIDEAHCISQWGHEFRPDYQKLKLVMEILGNPPVLALSATATKEVQDDIIHSIDRQAIKRHIYPMDRHNIALTIQEVMTNDEKIDIISNTLKNHRVPTLIYFSSKLAAETVSFKLSQRLPNHRIAFYHGGMEAVDRISIQQQFMNDQIDIICCTSAFGMGINKNNIRFVFHYHFPGQIESFIQEIGRAGRDGKQSISIVLYAKQDEFLPKQLIENELPTDEDLNRAYRYLNHLHKQDQPIPADGNVVQSALEISETQWRFLIAQLEKHGIKYENGLKYEQHHAKIFQQIKYTRNERLNLKHDKLRDMLHWLQTTNCLREELYSKFQKGYTPVDEYCCSNCGITLKNFNPVESRTEINLPTWEKKLKRLLLIGDYHETE
ncbi:RecQ family ATP-dependent DNA helicase [Ornithinibacillus scapharcae]|uniref:RecQ family ATP-dependent DNA helicase n=1 Tax=Ornithinibacillus scapharcae TaxID=1147159 RepID=UPI000225BBA8|nr:ATP-dependent DNA helicase RecQ [Ornithinibacillus scapharcae]